jgi:hypothetical protein
MFFITGSVFYPIGSNVCSVRFHMTQGHYIKRDDELALEKVKPSQIITFLVTFFSPH